MIKSKSDIFPYIKSDDESGSPSAKKRYVIPRNTLDFMKKKKLLYKVKPEEKQEESE